MQCLITNTFSCLLQDRMPSVLCLFFIHFGNTFIVCVTTMLYQTTKDCAGSDASVYQKLTDRYCDYIPVYTDGSRDGNYVACATVFPSNTIIFMRLPDLAIIKVLEEIKNSVASK